MAKQDVVIARTIRVPAVTEMRDGKRVQVAPRRSIGADDTDALGALSKDERERLAERGALVIGGAAASADDEGDDASPEPASRSRGSARRRR